MKLQILRDGIALCMVAGLAAGNGFPVGEKPGKEMKGKVAMVSFKSDVFPVIKKFCLPCHAEDNFNPSELHMDNYDMLMAGGKHGAPIVPGKPGESLLLQKLGESPPFGDRMPLKSKTTMSKEEIKVIVDWISHGAPSN